jgi:mediator of RNA polymerase II transcription subunit 18
MIQECYRFINGNVIFDLSRYLQLPNEAQASNYNTPLPAFETLTPFDAENKWILMISVRVVDGKEPDQAQKAVSELLTTKTEFEGCFNFHMVDRLIMDTRTRMT